MHNSDNTTATKAIGFGNSNKTLLAYQTQTKLYYRDYLTILP